MTRPPYLNQALALAPAALKLIVGNVDPSRFDERLSPERFSLREMMAHLADFEPVIRWRMETALANPGSDVPGWDEDKEAVAKDYGSWDVAATLDKFKDERGKTCELFESLTDEQLGLTVKHPGQGEISILTMAVFCLGHATYHLEQAAHYLGR